MGIFDKFKEIANGWRNHLIPPEELKEVIKEVSEARLKICAECPHNSKTAIENGYDTIRTDYHCTKCYCPLIAKTKSLESQCPIGKWEKIINNEPDKKTDTENS